MRTVYFLICLSIFFSSCNSKKSAPKSNIEIVKTYYNALNNKDINALSNILADSVLQKEIDYKMPFDKATYLELCKWDMALDANYKIISMAEVDGGVKAKITKIGKRLQFLHERPTIAEDFFEFENDKIRTLGATKFIVFDEKTFLKNRKKLTTFVDNHHPELNGFLYDQTPKGAAKYLKAIELFEAQK